MLLNVRLLQCVAGTAGLKGAILFRTAGSSCADYRQHGCGYSEFRYAITANFIQSLMSIYKRRMQIISLIHWIICEIIKFLCLLGYNVLSTLTSSLFLFIIWLSEDCQLHVWFHCCSAGEPSGWQSVLESRRKDSLCLLHFCILKPHTCPKPLRLLG